MKRNPDNLRAVGISFDVVVPQDVDANQVIQYIMDTFEGDPDAWFRIAAGDFGGDFTSTYEENYPDELYI